MVDILRVTELYSSHLKTENIKFDDPVTSDLIGALITVLDRRYIDTDDIATGVVYHLLYIHAFVCK